MNVERGGGDGKIKKRKIEKVLYRSVNETK